MIPQCKLMVGLVTNVLHPIVSRKIFLGVFFVSLARKTNLYRLKLHRFGCFQLKEETARIKGMNFFYLSGLESV